MHGLTNRQIESDSVDEVSRFLVNVVEYIVDESEKLLSYNATKNSRISSDCVRAIINSKREISLATISRRHDLKKNK
jgi:hypothetical protein